MSAVICRLKDGGARHVLRGLNTAGVEIIARRRSPHGSDCSCSEEHVDGPMGQCRCVRVMRLRVHDGGDWLLVFGDCAEGATVRLSGPYTHDTPLSYGGGFWCKVSV